MITTTQLRTRILSALGAFLGTYTLPDGSSTVALRIDDGVHYVTVDGIALEIPGVTANGLECVIQPDIDSEFTSLLGREFRYESTIRITLKQWDLTQNVIAASAALRSELRDVLSQVLPRQPRVSALDSIEQQIFLIQQQI